MRRGTIAFLAIICIVIIAGSIFLYQQIQQRDALRNVQISVDGVQIESVDAGSATLNISLRIINPNSIAVTIDRTDYTVFINNDSLGSGKNLHRVTIPAGGSVIISQPFTAPYVGATHGIWSYMTQDEVDWRIVGTAYFDTPLGTIAIPYEYSGTAKT
ncbi:MAG: hypothetical protein GX307_01150 [Euryarchaeota archaeon]|nr:hypothetical protein [Euryarchaeota archaeon]